MRGGIIVLIVEDLKCEFECGWFVGIVILFVNFGYVFLFGEGRIVRFGYVEFIEVF